jgi:hypothetical protein
VGAIIVTTNQLAVVKFFADAAAKSPEAFSPQAGPAQLAWRLPGLQMAICVRSDCVLVRLCSRRWTTNPQWDCLTPARILDIGYAFWAAKAALSATELLYFPRLAHGPLDADALRQRVRVHPRGARDFFDTLVAPHMLERHDGAMATHVGCWRLTPAWRRAG